jgi:hypothetical protein
VLTTDQKGAIAEAAITYAALELGIGVARPLGDEPYDLIFDVGGELLRVQCKWAVHADDVVIARCYRARRNAEGLVRTFYNPDEIDAFALYCAPLRRCYFFPFAECPPRGTIQLRLTPAKNNQRRRVHWAADFEFAARLRPRGAIAQLGERVHGMHEVAGSSPAGSIEGRPGGLRLFTEPKEGRARP